MKIHIIGICGTAMASLAHLLKQKKHSVSGSDKNSFPPMSDFLHSMEIPCLTPFSEDNIQPDTDLFIVGNAVTRGNPELEKILNEKKEYLSFPEALKRFFLQGKKNIVVTGTHGKTTTSSLLAHIFDESPREASYLIGGIPLKNETPALYRPKSPFFVIEGDEYDTAYFDKRSKFLHYLPETVIINNLEFDHADIFSSLEEIQKCFYHLVRIIPSNGALIINGDDENIPPCIKDLHCPITTFGEKKGNDLLLDYGGINNLQRGYGFFHYRGQVYSAEFSLPGKHNFFNAAAAFITALSYGISPEIILEALKTFPGIKRRLNSILSTEKTTVYEDFAHHPTAIEATLKVVKELHPQTPLLHCQDLSNNTSYRTVHQELYPRALKRADEIVFKMNPRFYKLPPEEKLDIETLKKSLTDSNLVVCNDNESVEKKIFSFIDKNEKSVILLSGTGNFQFLKLGLRKHFNKE